MGLLPLPVSFSQGCVNSTGLGGKLDGGAGTGISISGENFTLRGYQLPAGQNMLFFAGTALGGGVSIYSGVLCMGGTTNRIERWKTPNTGRSASF